MTVKQSEPAGTSAKTCPYLSGGVDEALSREWLLTNSLGGYASGTVISQGVAGWDAALSLVTGVGIGEISRTFLEVRPS